MNQNNLKIHGIAIAVIVAIVFLIGYKHTHDIPHDSSKWQAVFLTDGQVYFGKLGSYNSRFVRLEQVYYLKFSEGLQQGLLEQTNNQLNLIKLGGEAHGPEGEMFIAKDKILFIENLKEGSSVVKAILKNGN